MNQLRSDRLVAHLDDLTYDNSFANSLPADLETRNYRRQVLGAAYSRVQPTPVKRPELVAWSPDVAELLGLGREAVESADFALVMGGNALAEGMDPYAAVYGGHQFGNWAGQLGDGRAISLGEVLTEEGARFELQLKGAGPTPFSRMADGRAVLRSSIREFLCSEAMHHLGVPTTRALSLVKTGEPVVRDMFYDGNPKPEHGAVVCRVAPSFLRFGSFQIAMAREDEALLRKLADYTITTHFPELGEPGPETYVKWLSEVARRTAVMVTHWMRVGFVHGVMNTDNMSVLGLTIDYGPYGWLDNFDPGWTPNTTDAHGKRYRYGQQPRIALWNLVRFAESLMPLIPDEGAIHAGLDVYGETLDREQKAMMSGKLGLIAYEDGDDELVNELFETLQVVETDMTLFFRNLADVDVQGATDATTGELLAPLVDAFYSPDEVDRNTRRRFDAWLRSYCERARRDGRRAEERREAMNRVNPLYVLRNYLAQQAIDKSQEGDHSEIEELLDLMTKPYDVQPGRERFALKRPEWARHKAGCSMLSCSS